MANRLRELLDKRNQAVAKAREIHERGKTEERERAHSIPSSQHTEEGIQLNSNENQDGRSSQEYDLTFKFGNNSRQLERERDASKMNESSE